MDSFGELSLRIMFEPYVIIDSTLTVRPHQRMKHGILCNDLWVFKDGGWKWKRKRDITYTSQEPFISTRCGLQTGIGQLQCKRH